MTENSLITQIENGTGWIILNRPDVHNAFDDHLIADLHAAFDAMAADDAVHVVVMRAEGKSFSAGADLNWMKRMAGYSQAENEADSRKLAEMVRALDRLPKPVVGLIQGAAFGGGVGLVAACDIAVCAEEATFSLSEVKLGIIPAVISPYVVAAMGARQARRFFLTGERFGADTARRIGLVHKVVPAAELMTEGKRIVQSLLKNGPLAMAEAKDLIFTVADRPLDDELVEDTARRIARVRASNEGREGITAFLEKRKPEWNKG
ncbi:MAG: enoyl-CoA hydratase/isomerase family protein [Rhodospirillales bacterium]|nr:enoyl-CoA hydratase/isomerase family protein [Rhodospirillales bacterium]MCW8861285.1 enoyl-CoA hydratase/isomerase family protein [Rhodospirillales bacterium]MCW8951928.1 enoyl-CoA hydratase/isomerase family protein [Rhodospirillales bacterium]MCW8970332.1 enoyl-CoA hydratase/isomerase family protein [Rhodospirillales bacterium]MCW9001895.1 enoyl-CoA hydratase/isomerase family protein [Rhodospirillales bacterium]